jgi:hypothetical protein
MDCLCDFATVASPARSTSSLPSHSFSELQNGRGVVVGSAFFFIKNKLKEDTFFLCLELATSHTSLANICKQSTRYPD